MYLPFCSSPQTQFRRCRAVVGLFLLLICAVTAMAQDTAALKPDVRLVIDISGSMKRNDPNNLRQPAVDLLVRMVPDGAKAGVWTFGKSVNMLVPHQTVTASWRDSATQKSAEINSVGLFTNIGGALETAAHDLKTPDSSYVTNVILLTDGMVDIAKSIDENEAERRRIVEQLFPSLKQAGYKVHAVTLSDEADKNLMEKLALATGGTFAVAKTAEDLMKIFLQAFDLSVPSQKVPLTDNRFLIDSSINEFTALIFRKDPAEQTRLVGPDEEVIQESKPHEDVRWLRTEEYDLITVREPYEGEWRIVAAIEPESRVTVVSNLALRVKSLPSNLFSGAQETLNFALLADGKPVTDRTFLNLLQARVNLAHGADADSIADPHWNEVVPGTAADEKGVFTINLPMFDKLGVYDLQFTVDGKTFQRQFAHRITVREPFSASLEQEVDEKGVLQHLVKVRAHSELIDPQQTQIAASIVNPIRRRSVRPLEATRPGEWQAAVPMEMPGNYRITVQVTGTDIRREPFDYALTPITYTHNADTFFEPEPAVPDTKPEAVVEEVVVEESTPQEPPEKVEPEPQEQQEGISPWLWYVLFGLGNLVLAGGGYWLWRKLKSDATEDMPAIEPQETPGSPPPQMDNAEVREEEPPMEDLEEETEPEEDDLPLEDFERDLVEQVMAGEPEEAKEEFAAEIRRAQGLDLDPSELDDAITMLIDELDGEPRNPPDDFNEPDDSGKS